MTQPHGDLRVLICEDEYLLASDLATELGSRGVAVVGVMGRVSEIKTAMESPDFAANAVVLDVQLLDGMALDLVAPLLARGVAVVLCSGYGTRDLPPEFAHLPSVGKPTDTDQLLAALARFDRPHDTITAP
jgi:ActR/RegA family two-component response regulator